MVGWQGMAGTTFSHVFTILFVMIMVSYDATDSFVISLSDFSLEAWATELEYDLDSHLPPLLHSLKINIQNPLLCVQMAWREGLNQFQRQHHTLSRCHCCHHRIYCQLYQWLRGLHGQCDRYIPLRSCNRVNLILKLQPLHQQHHWRQRQRRRYHHRHPKRGFLITPISSLKSI